VVVLGGSFRGAETKKKPKPNDAKSGKIERELNQSFNISSKGLWVSVCLVILEVNKGRQWLLNVLK